MVIRSAWLVAILTLAFPAPDDGPALSISVDRPDEQLRRLLALFDGAPAADPASALASWKRATGRPFGFGKAWDAAIAALNPAMVRELEAFDDASVLVRFDPAAGSRRWVATLPRDDGTVSALATALSLTDGASLPPIGPATVDRLGPPGSALMARLNSMVVVGGDLDELATGLARLGAIKDRPRWEESRWSFGIDPAALRLARDRISKRMAEGLLGMDVRRVEGTLAIDGDQLDLRWHATGPRLEDSPAIDPSWLDGMPTSASVRFAAALNPSPTAWDARFAAADRVEKVDPAKVGSAPVRARLGVLAAAFGLRAEADVYPSLRGVSGYVSFEPEFPRPSLAVLRLHLADDASADRVSRARWPRSIGGRPLAVDRRGSTVRMGWGDDAIDAADRAEVPAASPLRSLLAGEPPPSRLALVSPGRLGLAPAGSAWLAALEAAPPVLYRGWTRDGRSDDAVRWGGLRKSIRCFLDRIPQKARP